MRESRPYRIGGRTKTKILFSETRNELIPFLKSYGEDVFVIIDPHSANLFPKGAGRSKNCVIADWDAEQETMDRVMELILRAREFGVRPETRWMVIGNEPLINLASLAASLYYGGAPLTLVPTSLLAMVSGSIGGSCGINYPGERYLCSSVYPAEEVIIDIGWLFRQEVSDLRIGFAEILRFAVLDRDGDFLDYLEKNSVMIKKRAPNLLVGIIERAIGVHIDYLEGDPSGEGIRKALELGRRFSWGFVLQENMRRFHGNSIVWGIGRAFLFGVQNGITDRAFAQKVLNIIYAYGYDLSFRLSRNVVQEYKHAYFAVPRDDMFEMVVPRGQGDCVLAKVRMDTLMRLLT